jgi:hypothetical protein
MTIEGGAVSLPLLLALQSAAIPASPEIVLTPIHFDLASVRPLDSGRFATRPQGCDRSDPDAITVCGRRPRGGAYPIEQWQRTFALDPIRAEMRLTGNLVGSAVVEQVVFPRGEVSNRVMLRIRMPF